MPAKEWLNIFASFIIDVWKGSKYTSAIFETDWRGSSICFENIQSLISIGSAIILYHTLFFFFMSEQSYEGTKLRLRLYVRGREVSFSEYQQWNTHFFSTQPQCCLFFSLTELQILLTCCLLHITIIKLRQIFYLVYSCPCLGLQSFS